jgi:hypothetical protein
MKDSSVDEAKVAMMAESSHAKGVRNSKGTW